MPERFGEDAGSWRADGVAGCTHPHGNATEGLGSPRARREESAADRSGLRSIGTGPHRMPETMRERATSYRDDVELEYPQSGERFRGRRNVLESRGHHPAGRRFEIRRTLGSGDLWVTEYVIFYDGRPVPTVSIMEFRDGKVAHETQYFADPFEAPAWRAPWRETKG